MGKKFLLISQVFYPDEVSTAGLFTDLARVMVAKGVNTEVWCAQPSYSSSVRQPSDVCLNGIQIKYLPSTSFRKDKFIGKFVNITTFSFSSTFKLLFSGSKEPVFTHTTPPFLGIIFSFICHLRRRKFIYILMDIFPEGLVRLGKISKKNPVVGIWKALFLSALRRSTSVVVIGRDMHRWLWDLCPDCRGKIRYIPNWQNEKIVHPIEFPEANLVHRLKLYDKFVVQYSGNMGLWNDMDTIAAAMTKTPENVIYMMVGGGVRKNELFRCIVEGQNLIELPFQPLEELSDVLASSHVGIVSMRSGLDGMAVPCKLYGIMAAARPVLAIVPENSEVAQVVREESCGLVVNPGDSDGLVAAIMKLKEDKQLRELMGKNALNAFRNKYSIQIAAEKYIKLLDE